LYIRSLTKKEKGIFGMNKRIIMLDVLGDKRFNITSIYQELFKDMGISEDILFGIDCLNPDWKFPIRYNPAGFIISGSIHNIGDNSGHEWQKKLCKFIVNYYNQIPILGVCFGHQIMAHALGGIVQINPKGREVGTVKITTTESAKQDIIFSEFSTEEQVNQSHAYSVMRLPNEATLLAKNEHSPTQAYRIGKSWGVQFHPEFRAPLFTKLYNQRISDLKENGDYTTANNLQKTVDDFQECNKPILMLKHFINHCLKR
jgi:GMP synthase-like glutamine amidotransferase